MELLERSREIEELRSLLADAANGSGATCLIEGPAGIGKTSLLAACGELGAEAGMAVLRARAEPLEHNLAWSVVRQLFAAVIGAAAEEREELLKGAAAHASPALGLAPLASTGTMHGLYWLTVALCDRAPLLIAIDDAHLADEPSLGFLAYLCARAADLPVLVALTVRTGEPGGAQLEAIGSRAEAKRLTPSPLSRDASRELTRSTLRETADDDFCDACFEATQGNPLLLHQLLDQLNREKIEPKAEHAPEVEHVAPEGVTRSLLLRLSHFPKPTRGLAEAVAVLGDGSRLADTARLAGLEIGAAASAADDLADAEILAPGTPLGFVHPIIREVLYASLPPLERAGMHATAARLLAESGAEPERVATQLLRTEPNGDPWVVERLREAAEQGLAAGAPGPAAALLERALAEPPPREERAAVLGALGRVEGIVGRPDGMERLREALELTADPRDRARLQLDLGRLLYIFGRSSEAVEALQRGLDELEEAGVEDAALTAELRAGWLGAARLDIALRPRAAALIHEIERLPASDESYGERALLAQLANELVFEGRSRKRAMELARMALGEGELIRQETSDGIAWAVAAAALGWSDDFDGFDVAVLAAQEDARRRGSIVGFATASYAHSFSRYYRGELADAVADAQQAIAASREGWSQFLTAARAQLSWALIDQGQLAAAQETLDRATGDPGWAQSSMQALVLEARARLHLARGEMADSLATALEAGQMALEGVCPNPAVLPWRSRAAVAAARLGDLDRAEELLDEGLGLAREFGAPRPIGVVLTAIGTVRGARGVEALDEAVSVLGTSPARLEHGRALVMLGAALRRTGRRKAARDVLRSGLDVCAASGATPLEELARSELVAAGGRPRRPWSTGPQALTPAEHRVASFASEGRTNREIAEALFVSLRTVETHLTSTYRKLGIDSRSQLKVALQSDRRAKDRGGNHDDNGEAPH